MKVLSDQLSKLGRWLLEILPVALYPSKLGISFFGLFFMLYLVSLQSQSGLLFLILGILFGCYAINFFAAYATARHLSLVPPESMTGTEGEPIKGSWTISNSSRRTLGLTETRSPWGPLFRIGALAGGESMHLTPDLPLPRRGIYPFTSLSLISSYPFGLVRCHRNLSVTGQFVVYPTAYDCAAPLAAGFEPMVGGKFTGKSRSSSGDSFHGVRPMQASDPVKLIHWSSSSKGLGLMVKEFDEELSGRVSIIMDAEPGNAPADDASKAPTDLPPESLLDWSCRAASSLMFSALDAGHQIEFVCLSDLEQQSVPPFADGSVVLSQLAKLHPTPGTATRERLRQALYGLPRKSSVCLVLTQMNPDIDAFIHEDLAEGRRRVSVYLPVHLRDSVAISYGTVRYYQARSMADA